MIEFKTPYRHISFVVQDNKLYMSFSGKTMASIAREREPKPDEVRQMVIKLGQRLRFSRQSLGLLLGTTQSTVRSWEKGWRKPSGSATKLIWYLTEYLHVRKSGRRLTSAYFIRHIRQKDGPYCTDLEIDRIRRADGSIRVFKEAGKLCLRLGTDKTPQIFAGQVEISDEARAAADEAMQRYGDKNDSELKTAVYLTAPMRFLLRREQSAKSNLYNAPNAPSDFLAAR